MTGDNSEDDNGDDDDLLKTFIGIIKYDDITTLTEKVYDFVRRGRNAAVSFVSEDEKEIRFNLDVLEDPDTEIRVVKEGPSEPPFQKITNDEEEFIELNVSVLNEKEREKVVSKIEEEFEKQGRFLTHEQEKGYGVAEGAKNDPEISKILGFFDFLEGRDKQLLRRGLSIRNAWEDDSIYPSGTNGRVEKRLRG